jgi:N-acetylglucosamine-6-sulfatase
VRNVAVTLVGTMLAVGYAAPAGASADRLERPREQHRPNVVVVMADDMRADDLRFMPHVRRLIAARGLTFENSFSPYPLCCPARASFLTGQYAHNHGVLDNASPYGFGGFDDSATLATSLRAAGYRTAFVGKYLNDYGLVPSRVTGEPSARFVPAGWSDWHGLLQVPYPVGAGTYHYFHPMLNRNGTVASYEGQYQTTLLGRIARDVVRDSAGDQPFFMYLSTLAPHDGLPHEADDLDYVRRDNGTEAWFPTPARPAWARGSADALVDRSPGIPVSGEPEADVSDKPRSVQMPPLNPAEIEAEARVTRQRAESLFVLDLEVARLVGTLRDTRELEDTVLVFTSDNGYFLGEHRKRMGKKLPYEPSIRVPLVLAGPGVPPGTRYDPVKTPDLTATIVDLAGARAPHPADGTSLLWTIRNGDRGWSVPVVTEAIADRATAGGTRAAAKRGFGDARTTIGLRTARYKLIRWASGAVELYDLENDPNELSNLARDAAYAEVRDRLTRLWWRYRDCVASECAAPLPALFRVDEQKTVRLTRQLRAGIQAYLAELTSQRQAVAPTWPVAPH